MDYKKVINELRDISFSIVHLWGAVEVMKDEENIQKNKKTEKMVGINHCSFTALYTTKKYGCSGLKGKTECLECKYRR